MSFDDSSSESSSSDEDENGMLEVVDWLNDKDATDDDAEKIKSLLVDQGDASMRKEAVSYVRKRRLSVMMDESNVANARSKRPALENMPGQVVVESESQVSAKDSEVRPPSGTKSKKEETKITLRDPESPKVAARSVKEPDAAPKDPGSPQNNDYSEEADDRIISLRKSFGKKKPSFAAKKINESEGVEGPRRKSLKNVIKGVMNRQVFVRKRRASLLESDTAVRTTDERGHKLVNGYVIEKTLGSGSYGKVKLCSKNGKQYAIKIIKRPKKRLNMHCSDNTQEIAVMKKMSHPNLTKLIEVIDDPSCNKIYLVLEFVEGGPIFEERAPSGESELWEEPLEEELCRKYARDICMGLEYLHFQKVVHRDLKPSNLLIAKDQRIKISDFGTSTLVEDVESVEGDQGSPAFQAPEVILGEGSYAGSASDVWSFGATLFMMAFGRPPFVGATIKLMQDRILKDEVNIPSGANPHLQDLLRQMMCKDASQRIELPKIMQHNWITECGIDPLPLTKYVAIEVTEQDKKRVFSAMDNLVTILKLKSKVRNLVKNMRARIKTEIKQKSAFEKGSSFRYANRRFSTGASTNNVLNLGSSSLNLLQAGSQKNIKDGASRNRSKTAIKSDEAKKIDRFKECHVMKSKRPRRTSSLGAMVEFDPFGRGNNVNSRRRTVGNIDLFDRDLKNELKKADEFESRMMSITDAADFLRDLGVTVKNMPGFHSLGKQFQVENLSLSTKGSFRKHVSSVKNALSTISAMKNGDSEDRRLNRKGQFLMLNTGFKFGSRGVQRGSLVIQSTSSRGSLARGNSFKSDDGAGPGEGSRTSSRKKKRLKSKLSMEAKFDNLDVDQHLSDIDDDDGVHKVTDEEYVDSSNEDENSDSDGSTYSDIVECDQNLILTQSFKKRRRRVSSDTQQVNGDKSLDLIFHDLLGPDVSSPKMCTKIWRPPATSDCISARSRSDFVSVENASAQYSPTLHIVYSEHHEQGKRKTMEDASSCEVDLRYCSDVLELAGQRSIKLDEYQVALFAVFDGHSGDGAAKFLASHFKSELGCHEKLIIDTEAAIIDAALSTDASLLEFMKTNQMFSGCTGNMVVVLNKKSEAGDKFKQWAYCGNVGDARAVACTSTGNAVDLSKDHKVRDPQEKERIKKAGGWVTGGRLMGVLAVSRSFGDPEYKTMKEECWDQEFSADLILARPDVQKILCVDENGFCHTPFIVIACDGIYDVMSSQAVVNCVRKELFEHNDADRAARGLIAEALNLESQDNCSAIVICFGQHMKGEMDLSSS